MSTEIFGPEPEGATPLSEDDYLGLKPKWVATREDLNQAEARNILQASEKYFTALPDLSSLLDDYFVRQLHREMFSDVWTWAGKYRQIETSIGVDPRAISESVNVLVNNALVWFKNADAHEIDRTVCEVHHRLVQIHPFRNGNGRFSRLFADLMLVSLGRKVFDWGGGDLEKATESRSAYIAALRKADAGDINLLCDFVRSGTSA